MNNSEAALYRIVFKGELAYGFEPAEVRANLKQLCRYDDPALDRLFSGRPAVIKSKLPLETARKYLGALERTGAVFYLEELQDEAPAVALAVPAAPTTTTCPKCNTSQPAGSTCVSCGIVFAKYRQLQERQEAIARGEVVPPRPGSATAANHADDTGLMGSLSAHLARHQEQAFVLKAFLVIAAILFVSKYLSGFLFLLILLFPVLFLIYVRLEAGSTGQSPYEVLAQHITFMPVMYAEGERKTEGAAWATYSIILTNILVFYGFELNVDPELIFKHLLFIPYEPNPVNVPVSLITSIFLHADNGHLWGNMLFLWAVGTVVEKRIGWPKFLLYYFLAGIMASLLSALVTFVFFQAPVHGLGASGAIAGVMGIFAVRCYFKSMVFPLPILGIFSLILPVSLKVRLNSLVIIGLFFLLDLSGGIEQIAGNSDSNIGHWAHIGGMLCGIGLALLSKLGEEAIEERHVEIGRQTMKRGGDLYSGEESMRLALQRNPENGEVMLMLARLLSKFQPTAEGEDLYRRGMTRLIGTHPTDVMEAFRDYFPRYLKGIDPHIQLRLAALYQKHNDYTWASRCLELLADDAATPLPLREKAMFQCAHLMEHMGNFDAASHYYRLFVETFPESAFCAKAQARLAPA